jgi:hypothetical protein
MCLENFEVSSYYPPLKALSFSTPSLFQSKTDFKKLKIYQKNVKRTVSKLPR